MIYRLVIILLIFMCSFFVCRNYRGTPVQQYDSAARAIPDTARGRLWFREFRTGRRSESSSTVPCRAIWRPRSGVATRVSGGTQNVALGLPFLAPGSDLWFGSIAQANAPAFHSTRLTRHYEVRPILEVSPSSDVGRSTEYPFTVNVDIKNLTAGSSISIYQVTTLSPIWSCTPLTEDAL